jgi:rhodanese-related sulfurtransferase
VCTFGTGGTSGGLSRYGTEKYSKKLVHVVFPQANQDVAGIRTKNKAEGLRFYEPNLYAGQTEVDFEQAKPLLKFFVDKGYDLGESSALALYAAMQMANFGGGGNNRFIVIIADGIKKYRKALEAMSEEESEDSLEVDLDRAASNIQKYDKIVWIHTMYTPRNEGVELIAKSLGVDPSKIVIPKASTVERMLMTQKIPEELSSVLGGENTAGQGGKALLVCMMGNTSLMAAQVMSSKGVKAQSLTGGISALSQGKGKQMPELVKMATE